VPLTLTTVWADERLYYPLHAQPYTPASHFSRKQADPEFRTKLQIAADLIAKALAAGVTCRAVVADSFYGEHDDLRAVLRQSGLGFVMALGRLPSPLRDRDPSPSNPRELRVLVLLGHLVRPTIHKRQHRSSTGIRPRRLRREGAPKPAPPLNSPAGESAARRPRLAHPVAATATLLDSLDQQTATPRTPTTAQRRRNGHALNLYLPP